MSAGRLIENRELRNRTGVFRDRAHAGRVLAVMLSSFAGTDSILLAMPAGGIPVAASMA